MILPVCYKLKPVLCTPCDISYILSGKKHNSRIGGMILDRNEFTKTGLSIVQVSSLSRPF